MKTNLICTLENLHYLPSREKFEPEPGFEPRTRMAQVVERRARDPEARGSNPV